MLDHLEFVNDSLVVRYNADGPGIQQLDVDVRLAGPTPVDYATPFLHRVMDIINFGAAGGSQFDPAEGSARLLTATPQSDSHFGPSFHWSLEVAGVAPVALRTFVEQLRQCGGLVVPVASMALTGARPLGLESDPHKATEREVREWLSSPDAYVEEWPNLGFPVHTRRLSSGATLRILLQDEITPPLSEELRTLCIAWLNFTSEYISDWGEHVVSEKELYDLPQFGQGKRELSARYREFNRKRAPSRAVIVNCLQRFHQLVAPIAEVEVGLHARD